MKSLALQVLDNSHVLLNFGGRCVMRPMMASTVFRLALAGVQMVLKILGGQDLLAVLVF
jgi:hypothetical protein